MDERKRMIRSVKIGGRRIPVRRRPLPKDTWGMTWLEDPEPEIVVSPRLRSPRSILTTILHESLHRAFPKAREHEILRMETRLAQLIRDNPTLFRHLSRT